MAGIAKTGIQGRDGNNITLQTYYPMGNGPFPVLVFFHGGGFVVGSVLGPNPYDASCRAMCNLAHCVVVEVDYRLAPENPYPAAVNDCYDALKYVQTHLSEFKGQAKVAVAGESAGGNLAVAVPLMAKDMGTQMPTSIVSIYPVGGAYTNTPSTQKYYSAIPLDTPSLTWFYEKYAPTAADRSARYFDIVKADLHGLPPTTVITDQIDPLNSDGRMLVQSLQAAGVDTSYMNYDGVTHEFFGMGQVVDKAKQAEMFAADALLKGWGMQSMYGNTGTGTLLGDDPEHGAEHDARHVNDLLPEVNPTRRAPDTRPGPSPFTRSRPRTHGRGSVSREGRPQANGRPHQRDRWPQRIQEADPDRTVARPRPARNILWRLRQGSEADSSA